MNKEHHGATAPEVSFIFKLLEDAYGSDLSYDVTDMRPAIFSFAAGSTHQAQNCIRMVNNMKFASKDRDNVEDNREEAPIVFYDVEVFSNLFVCNWKYRDTDKEKHSVVRMINPTPKEIEELLNFRLIGFNNRRYDNHILYARMQGYSNEELYRLSQRIINGSKNAMFKEAYNLSYTDIYDFCSKKQSLKKWEIELGIHHQELGLKWDEPVPEELWTKVAEYCDNDVIATEAVFNARQSDWLARQILADLSGLTVNDTTNTLTTRLIVGTDQNPQSQFVYTDLSTIFPGYIFENGKSHYRGEDIGEGGYVYAEPGMYSNVVSYDVAGMHPASIRRLNVFGDEYTKNFGDIVDARLAVKHGDYDKARQMYGGKLNRYLDDKEAAKNLAQALKIAVNAVYGLTAASFDNKLKDPRNKDNIVAKYGELFMINLKHEVQDRGFTVVHIKTDSIKVENPIIIIEPVNIPIKVDDEFSENIKEPVSKKIIEDVIIEPIKEPTKPSREIVMPVRSETAERARPVQLTAHVTNTPQSIAEAENNNSNVSGSDDRNKPRGIQLPHSEKHISLFEKKNVITAGGGGGLGEGGGAIEQIDFGVGGEGFAISDMPVEEYVDTEISEAVSEDSGNDLVQETFGEAHDDGEFHSENSGDFSGKKVFELEREGDIGFNNEPTTVYDPRAIMVLALLTTFGIGAIFFSLAARDIRRRSNYF